MNEVRQKILSEANSLNLIFSDFELCNWIAKPKIEKVCFGGEYFFGLEKNGESYLSFIQIKEYLKKVFNLFSEDHLKTLIEKLNVIFINPTVNEKQALLPYLLVEDSKLISLTDSERLLGIIQTLIGKKEIVLNTIKSHLSFVVVEHDCFGGNSGKFFFQLPQESKRIECSTCFGLFFPKDFVRHSHLIEKGNRVVQWGFNPTNWRSLLWIVSQEENNSELSTVNERLSLDLNNSNFKEGTDCPIWANEEEVINTNINVNSSKRSFSYEGFRKFITVVVDNKCGKFKETEMKIVMELFDQTVNNRLRTLIEEREKLLVEIEILKTEMRKLENDLSHV
ncbi:hypothetical protein FO519_003223 [Halicephalobus sp. NKZ332]|nr:hypothetical protein FO519_003223 [Halicephalobus sp. NKZ332]